MKNYMEFSERLLSLRQNKGVLQQDIAQAIGISKHSYQRFEYGEREPRLSVLIALADFYGITLDELVGRNLST